MYVKQFQSPSAMSTSPDKAPQDLTLAMWGSVESSSSSEEEEEEVMETMGNISRRYDYRKRMRDSMTFFSCVRRLLIKHQEATKEFYQKETDFLIDQQVRREGEPMSLPS